MWVKRQPTNRALLGTPVRDTPAHGRKPVSRKGGWGARQLFVDQRDKGPLMIAGNHRLLGTSFRLLLVIILSILLVLASLG